MFLFVSVILTNTTNEIKLCTYLITPDKQGKDELPDTKLFESEGSLTYVVITCTCPCSGLILSFDFKDRIQYYQVMFPSKKPSTKLDWTIGILNKSTLIIKKVINKSDVVVIQMKLLNRLVDDTLLIQFEADWSVLELTLTKPVAGKVYPARLRES